MQQFHYFYDNFNVCKSLCSSLLPRADNSALILTLSGQNTHWAVTAVEGMCIPLQASTNTLTSITQHQGDNRKIQALHLFHTNRRTRLVSATDKCQ